MQIKYLFPIHTIKHSTIFLFLLLAVSLLCCACAGSSLAQQLTEQNPGEVTLLHDKYGQFYAYVPNPIPSQLQVLVVIHGTPQKWDSAEFTDHYYAQAWSDFAQDHGLILIVPAFTQEDFSSRYGDHALNGYRGLFGREIGADEWVMRLVDTYQQHFAIEENGFYLYGHSAGGQYTARFLVTHPERILKAVISSAATYPQPNKQVEWPFGMGELHAEIEWDDGTITQADVIPDEQTWLAATQISLTVIVGLGDTAELPQYPGQKGIDRYTIASNWVKDMCTFAEQHERECSFGFVIIPGRGHSMSGLLPYSQESFSLD